MSSQDYSEHYIGLPHRIPLQKATIVILESDLISLALDVLFMSMLGANLVSFSLFLRNFGEILAPSFLLI